MIASNVTHDLSLGLILRSASYFSTHAHTLTLSSLPFSSEYPRHLTGARSGIDSGKGNERVGGGREGVATSLASAISD